MASKAEKLAKKIFGPKFIKSRKKRGGSNLVKKYKVVVFVPHEKTDELAFAMASAGAGEIGNYSVCSFRMKGVGTFMGNESSNPAHGAKRKFEMTEEIRLEMICDKKNIDDVVDKIYEVHPYDEPAFEIYDVLTKEKTRSGEIISFQLKKKIPAKELLKKINPELDPGSLPAGLKKIKIRSCIIDCSGRENNFVREITPGTLYITKNKKQIKAYIA
ncbi:MAG TPA: hypothetical protein VJ455_12495 [Ignavibacteria bacterium]|nr:hypothetical protein [Ignavibacteria bacterium]